MTAEGNYKESMDVYHIERLELSFYAQSPASSQSKLDHILQRVSFSMHTFSFCVSFD